MRNKMVVMVTLMGAAMIMTGCPMTGGGGTTDPCEGVMCNEGQECVDGECVAVDPCEGVTCDTGQTCVDGECVAMDPCEGVTCDTGQTCVDGECVATDPCEGVTCDTGQTCVDGECVATDPCEGVTCDDGQECVDGECVPTMATGDAANGAMVYSSTCMVCHGENATGNIGPNIQGASAATIQAHTDGEDGHVMYDVSAQDVLDLEAYLGTF